LCLEKFLQVIFGEDRKSMSGDSFSILVILILHRFDLVLHASLMMIYRMFLLFLIKIKIKIKKIGGENVGNFIYFFPFLGMSDIACIFA
jgi:hypothetical protein